MLLLSPDLRIREMNATFRRRFPEARIGDLALAISYDTPAGGDRGHPALRALRMGQSQDDVVEGLRGGKMAYHRVYATPLRDRDGDIAAVVVAVEDITQQQELQQNLQKRIEQYNRAIQWQDDLAQRMMGYQKELRQKNQELEEAKKELERLSVTDPLTRLFNRRYFDEAFLAEARRCGRYNHPLSLLMMDLDHFKQVNDTYLHESGDRVLQEVGDVLRRQLRETDTTVRYGGEEFAAILPETTLEIAASIGERLRQAIRALVVTIPDGRTVSITISIGVASAIGGAIHPADLLHRADAALYRAKAAGRYKVLIDPVS
jgi:diguanylate cyclase (GGDEF)-like protein